MESAFCPSPFYYWFASIVSVCDLVKDQRFAALGNPRRIWAISAIHAEADRLVALHDSIYPQLEAGDRIVYLGNYFGHGTEATRTIDEILTFRRNVLAMPGWMPSDIAYLRGGQEEMWEKLVQLQFAPNPREVLEWMLDHGLSATLESYGMNPTHGLVSTREGAMSITRWTAGVRAAIRRHRGHDMFITHLRRAAFTPPQVMELAATGTGGAYARAMDDSAAPMLFVHAGLNPNRPLQDQGDALWWGGRSFDAIHTPYDPFEKVIRGFDPNQGGLHINGVTATLDGGCGFGGPLVCAGFDRCGEVFSLIES